ncbi:MAG: hypothetical protein V4773_17970 [Verrucomicrobiota bacterium]
MKLLRFILQRRWLLVLVALGILGGVSYYPLKHVVRPRVKAWRSAKLNESARDFLRQEDWLNALLMTRKNLQGAADNVEAWRIAALAAKKLNRPEAIFYQDSLCRLSPSKENQMEYIRLAILFKQDGMAVQGIKKAGGSAANDPDFHEMAAQVYSRLERRTESKYHLLSLLELRPTDKKAELDLAAIEIAEDTERKNLALRGRIRSLADNPESRLRALSMLLADSVRGEVIVETAELANRLRLVPNLPIHERLLLVHASHLATPAKLAEDLAALQRETATKASEVSSVMRLMSTIGMNEDVPKWYRTLTDEVRASEIVKLSVAEAIFALKRWSELRSLVTEGSWTNLEYVRRAFLAYTYKVDGSVSAFDEAWKGAVLDAGDNVRETLDLYTRVERWGWQRERFDVLWRLFSMMPENKDIRQMLLLWERQQGNTANLNRLFARIVDMDPNDRVAKNNFAYTSLLLDANVSRAGLIAKEVVEAEPENPYYKTTLALSLYKQGKEVEALTILDSLRTSALATPERTALRALFLAGNGKHEEASAALEKIVARGLLPEEKRLSNTALSEIAKNQRSKDNVQRLRSIQDTGTAGFNRAGFLVLLPATLSANPSVEMQLADSLFAAKDLKALSDILREGQWRERDFIRLALLSYTQRRDQAGAARDSWQHALSIAPRNAIALQSLCDLASKWSWTTERIEALNVLHAFAPGDSARLNELMAFYRQAKRTPELVRVLRPWIENSRNSPESVAYAYYALLSNVDLSQATVMAKNAFDADPRNAERRFVYAFSLWRQQRFPEADAVLKETQPALLSLLQSSLIRALVALDNGNLPEAQQQVSGFDEAPALPEELELVRKVTAKVAELKS